MSKPSDGDGNSALEPGRVLGFAGRQCSRGVWGHAVDVPKYIRGMLQDPVKLAELLSGLLDVAGGKNASRDLLLRDLMGIVNDLMDGDCCGQGLCRVIGGTGATRFLSAFMAAMQSQADKNFIVVTVCCGDADVKEVEPAAAIRNSLVDLGFDEPPVWGNCSDMNRWLLKRKIRIVLMYSEVEALYSEDGVNRARALRQLHAIGNYSANRSIVAFITGESPHLRGLLFRDMADVNPTLWPGYPGAPDMNARKYLIRDMTPDSTKVMDIHESIF